MAELKHSDRAHIFILKLWQEIIDDEQNHKQTEWRGRIQDVFNGETHYFRDWPTVVKFIENIMPELENTRRMSRRRSANGHSNGRSIPQPARRRTENG